ncbi:MAG: hypothetical protein AUK48_13420 [Oscillatoriales cyanobacterium CG2_30_44_21]|nr:MAG: hypothetical protein AUK48_13420 [Oscillatoriales cyanobacterium CG2_30_44_21]
MNVNQIFEDDRATPEERFELLSAYIDGEVTEQEEQLVEKWLSDDVNLRRLYQQQLKLRQLLIELPVPVAANSSVKTETEVMVSRVFAEIDRRSQRRKWKIAGIGLVAATVVGIFGSIFTINSSPQFSPVANNIRPTAPVAEEPVLIAMEEPLVPLPKSMVTK